MKRLCLAVVLLMSGAQQSAFAQEPPSTVQAMQTLLADIGAWSLDYQSVVERASRGVQSIDGYVQILDRYALEEIDAATASASIDAWRVDALSNVNAARALAHALRRPPSMAALGERGAGIDSANGAAFDNLAPLIDEIGRLVNRIADVGLSSVSDRTKLTDARTRAVLQSQQQLLSIGNRRIGLSISGISDESPSHAFFSAMRQFYAALGAYTQNELDALDGHGDDLATAATVEEAAVQLRAECDRAQVLLQRAQEGLRWQQAGEFEPLVATVMRVLESVPDSISQYRRIADALDHSARSIREGTAAVDAWANLEIEVQPILQEISRLEVVRAQLLGQRGSPL